MLRAGVAMPFERGRTGRTCSQLYQGEGPFYGPLRFWIIVTLVLLYNWGDKRRLPTTFSVLLPHPINRGEGLSVQSLRRLPEKVGEHSLR